MLIIDATSHITVVVSKVVAAGSSPQGRVPSAWQQRCCRGQGRVCFQAPWAWAYAWQNRLCKNESQMGKNPCIQKCKESGSGQGPEAPLSVVMVVRLNFCAQLSANLYLFCKICVQGDIGPPARCCPALPAAILGNDDKIY